MYLVGCTFLSFNLLKVALWVAPGRGQGNLDTCVAAAEGCFLLEEGDLACGAKVETPTPCRVEAKVLGFWGVGLESGVAGRSLHFAGGGTNAMGRVDLDRILLL